MLKAQLNRLIFHKTHCQVTVLIIVIITPENSTISHPDVENPIDLQIK